MKTFTVQRIFNLTCLNGTCLQWGKKSGTERFRYSHILFYLVLISILGWSTVYTGNLRGCLWYCDASISIVA
jgi:hypothetical protein